MKLISRFNKGGSSVVAGSELVDSQELLYIPTLEARLIDYVKEHDNPEQSIDLILISGTAGDGKTVLLHKFKEITKGSIGDRKLIFNFDASHADEPSQKQYDVLKKFFNQYKDANLKKKPSSIKIIAINTGMLMHFFKTAEDNGEKYQWLQYLTLKELNLPRKIEKPSKGKKPLWNVLLIDLSLRNLFLGKDSIFDLLIAKMFNKIVKSEQCQSCSVRNSCYLYTNISILEKESYTRNKLKNRFIQYEIEKNAHVTLRMLLESLSYLIAGHFSEYSQETCEDEIKIIKEGEENDFSLLFDHLFYNMVYGSHHNLFEKEYFSDMPTIQFFREEKSKFLDTKYWTNYKTNLFSSITYEIDDIAKNMVPLEDSYFSIKNSQMKELKKQLVLNENQNKKFLLKIHSTYLDIKNIIYNQIISRQYFNSKIEDKINYDKDISIQKYCFDSYKKILLSLSSHTLKKQEENKIKNGVIKQVCKALTLSEFNENVIKDDKFVIYLQRKYTKTALIKSISSPTKIEIDPEFSDITLNYVKTYELLFHQLPRSINVVLAITGSKKLNIEIDFSTYFFIFRILNGYKPSVLDKEKFEEIEMLKQKLLFLSPKFSNIIELENSEGYLLKIEANKSGNKFEWWLECQK